MPSREGRVLYPAADNRLHQQRDDGNGCGCCAVIPIAVLEHTALCGRSPRAKYAVALAKLDGWCCWFDKHPCVNVLPWDAQYFRKDLKCLLSIFCFKHLCICTLIYRVHLFNRSVKQIHRAVRYSCVAFCMLGEDLRVDLQLWAVQHGNEHIKCLDRDARASRYGAAHDRTYPTSVSTGIVQQMAPAAYRS